MDLEHEIEENSITYQHDAQSLYIPQKFINMKRIYDEWDNHLSGISKIFREIFNLVALVIFKIFKFVYVVIYFYFMPTLTRVFVFFYGDLALKADIDECDN